MTSILVIGLSIALATIFMLSKHRKDKPVKVKRQEKSEVLRQLLALSEQENHISKEHPTPGKTPTKSQPFVSSTRKS